MADEAIYYTLPMAHKLLAEEFGLSVTVQTVYNWAKRGIKVDGEHVFLPTVFIANRRLTTKEWLREFTEIIGT